MVNDMKSMWNGLATVIVYELVENEETGRSEYSEKIIYEDISCHFIHKSIGSLKDESPTSSRLEGVLLTDKDVVIPKGSKIILTQNEVTREYSFSAEALIYKSHREVPLALFERWV